jgi:putative flippase GtrA
MIRRELIIFIIVGSLIVLIDFLTYRGLVWSQLLGVDLSKAIGFLTGTVFAYFANRFWTFGHKTHMAGSAWRFAIVYSISLGTNVQINAVVLTWLPDTTAAVQIAFLLATGASTIMNFLGMKLFVFQAAHISDTS